MQRGKFLTVEGTEGVGKSTNIAFIHEWLTNQGIDVVMTREPGGTPFAEEIRHLLLQKREERVDPTSELLLVFAARAQHMAEVIEPALARGAWVLSDRFTDATYAYQGGGRGLDMDLISSLETLVQRNLHPDMTIILDIDVQVGLDRASARAALDRFESEQISFFERVRAVYRARAEAAPERYRIVDAGHSLDGVQREISAVLSELML